MTADHPFAQYVRNLGRGSNPSPSPTAAIALGLLGRAATIGEATAMAETMWTERNRKRLAAR